MTPSVLAEAWIACDAPRPRLIVGVLPASWAASSCYTPGREGAVESLVGALFPRPDPLPEASFPNTVQYSLRLWDTHTSISLYSCFCLTTVTTSCYPWYFVSIPSGRGRGRAEDGSVQSCEAGIGLACAPWESLGCFYLVLPGSPSPAPSSVLCVFGSCLEKNKAPEWCSWVPLAPQYTHFTW